MSSSLCNHRDILRFHRFHYKYASNSPFYDTHFVFHVENCSKVQKISVVGEQDWFSLLLCSGYWVIGVCPLTVWCNSQEKRVCLYSFWGMERYSRSNMVSQVQFSGLMKQQRSGYEPSDTETEWHESPSRDYKIGGGFGLEDKEMGSGFPRNTSPMRSNRRHHSKTEIEYEGTSPIKEKVAMSLRRRHSSKSPYKPRRDDATTVSPKPASELQRNASPLSRFDQKRHVLPYKIRKDEGEIDNNEIVTLNRKQNNRTPGRVRSGATPHHIQRSVTAPKVRIRDTELQTNFHQVDQKEDRTPSPMPRGLIQKQRQASPHKTPSVGEINEMVANLKFHGGPTNSAPNFESTESIALGDIFFSRDHTAFAFQKDVLPKNNTSSGHFRPVSKALTANDGFGDQQKKTNGGFDLHSRKSSSSMMLSRMTINSSTSVSRQSSGKLSTSRSKMSDVSAKTTESAKKFTANRRKSQTEAWFTCMRKGSCRTSKGPEPTMFDEASYIEKAIVVENLRQFWADKHKPGSLDGFICHKQEAQLLKQLVANDVCPHILFKGPSGSGKKALTMALLREIYGDQSLNVSHELRHFQIQDKRHMQIAVPITSSPHHVELNVHKEPNARYALTSLVKEISGNHAITPEVSTAYLKADHKVIVLYQIDKAPENYQHLIKWIIDCYSDACILIQCCEDDGNILESVRNRCKVINVDAPTTHEIMDILIQIARKEDFELSLNFAARIASKSKQNLRKAIMALEACKAHNYPFVDDQPIPFGWEEVLVELAAEILADPSPKRLFFARGKIQKLLVDFVHPKLVLLKLVEQFLKGVASSSKRELHYWHAYYDKRLPTGTSALLKLEEFVAKFMSMHRKSLCTSQCIA